MVLPEKALAGTGWFSRQQRHDNERAHPNCRAKERSGVQNNLIGTLRLKQPFGRPVHDSVTVRLALGKSLASGHLPARLRQHPF